MRTMTEAALEKYAKKECKKHGIANYKFTSPAKRGVPDQLWVHCSRVVFVELKTPAKTGRLSPLQIHELNRLVEQGAEIYVIDEYEQIDELINFIRSNRRPETCGRSPLRIRPYISYS